MTQKSFLITLLLSGVMAFSAHAMEGSKESALDPVSSSIVKAAAPVEATKDNAAVALPAASAVVVAQDAQLANSASAAVEQEDEAEEAVVPAEIDNSDLDSSEYAEELARKFKALQEEALAAEEAKKKSASDFAAAQAEKLAQDQAAAEAKSKEKAARKARIQDLQNQMLQAEATIKASLAAKEEYESRKRALLASAAEKPAASVSKKPEVVKTPAVATPSDKSAQKASDLDFAQNIGNQDQIETDKKAKASVAQASAVATPSDKSAQVASDAVLAEKLGAKDQVETDRKTKASVAQASAVAKPSDKSVVATPSDKSAQVASDGVLAEKLGAKDQVETDRKTKSSVAKAAADSKPGTAFGVRITPLKFTTKS